MEMKANGRGLRGGLGGGCTSSGCSAAEAEWRHSGDRGELSRGALALLVVPAMEFLPLRRGDSECAAVFTAPDCLLQHEGAR